MKIDIIDAIKQIAACNNVNFTIYKENESEELDFDMGLRRIFWSQQEKKDALGWLLEYGKEGTIYFGNDYFALEYCIAKFPEAEREYGELLIIGPYLEDSIEVEKMQEMLSSSMIPVEYRSEMGEYFRAIPVMKNCGQWRDMCSRFIGMLYGGAPTQIEYLAAVDILPDFSQMSPGENLISQELVEKRYLLENEFIRAIGEGNVDEALRVMNQIGQYRLEKRYKSPVREIRNSMISANTLMRKAAEQGGVHPMHVDQLSGQMAKKIETLNTQKEYDRMMTELIRKYCMLVQNYSVRGYSPVIQKVTNHINLNLSQNLSLNVLAKEYAVSASYLSTLFKKEMGLTVTDYVNQQRIRRAIGLLNTTDMQIQDIASECGIYDVSYFRKLFKRYIGKTPTDYLKQIKRE